MRTGAQLIAAVVLITAATSEGTGQRAPRPLLTRSLSTEVISDSALMPLRPSPMPREASRAGNAKRGAWFGAVVGAMGGVLAGISASERTGCDVTVEGRSTCNVRQTQLAITAMFTGFGAAVGAASGAVVGALWPVSSASSLQRQTARTR